MTPSPYSCQDDEASCLVEPTNPTSPAASTAASQKAVVIVTPYSTGCCLALEIQKRGYKLICLWSEGFAEQMKSHVPASCTSQNLYYDLVLDEGATLEETANMVLTEARQHKWEVVACMCGGEAGVDLTDALSERLGLLTNGTEISNRRDKKVQQELVKAAGLRSIRQVSGNQWDDQVQDFLLQETYPVVVKPLDSAGSDGVKLCQSFEEAKEHFIHLLEDHDMINGGSCTEVLCQEFLKGTEYVVDFCSRDGVHKTAMVWRYDKRAVNGANFVYFGDIPIDPTLPEAQVMIPYVRDVLDAMQIKNGPTHAEVILTADGPCLVEVNCRAFGGDGIWQPLCRAMTGGYNQIDMTVSAYLDDDKASFCARYPDVHTFPSEMRGQIVDLVSFSEGTVKSTPGYDIIKSLPSLVSLETGIQRGSQVVPTVDLVTSVGSCVLMHIDASVLERDIATIRKLEQDNLLFEYYVEQEEEEEEEEKKEDHQLHHRIRSCSMEIVMDQMAGSSNKSFGHAVRMLS